eukprot:Skav223452  [mRNA]  locus=scaffold350:967387:969446:- [translate_table: standard]
MDMESSIYDSSSEEESDVKIPLCIRHPGWTNLILVTSYCFFGVAFLTTQQQWHPATALYVVVQIVTTIGYGDITVTDEEKIFMTLYVLLGTVVVAKVVNDVSEELLASANAQIDASLHRVEEFLHVRAEKNGSHGCSFWHDLINATLIFLFFVVLWVVFFVFYESCTCSYGFTHIDGCVLESCRDTGGSVKTVVDAVYMAVITYSTVGFGDYTPDTKAGRMFACVMMVLGVVAFFNMVSAVAHAIRASQRYYAGRLRLSKTGFTQIDRDGSGFINITEFQIYMLLRQGRVTVQQLNHLDRLFECMDTDKTGRLSYEEISAGLLDTDLK